MIRMLCLLPLLLLLLPPALEAQAPFQPEPIVTWESAPALVPPTSMPGAIVPEIGPHRVAVTAAGSMGGFAAGPLIGGLTVYRIFAGDRRYESALHGAGADPFVYEDHEFVPGIMGGIAALAGGTIGAPLGAHLANGRRGNPWLGVLGAAGATVGTLWIMDMGRSRTLQVVLPLAVVSTATAVEILTTR